MLSNVHAQTLACRLNVQTRPPAREETGGPGQRHIHFSGCHPCVQQKPCVQHVVPNALRDKRNPKRQSHPV
eukprot:5542546-Alexandrium_andersonii.AAC.1